MDVQPQGRSEGRRRRPTSTRSRRPRRGRQTSPRCKSGCGGQAATPEAPRAAQQFWYQPLCALTVGLLSSCPAMLMRRSSHRWSWTSAVMYRSWAWAWTAARGRTLAPAWGVALRSLAPRTSTAPITSSRDGTPAQASAESALLPGRIRMPHSAAGQLWAVRFRSACMGDACMQIISNDEFKFPGPILGPCHGVGVVRIYFT
jgi:hypothetical protein